MSKPQKTYTHYAWELSYFSGKTRAYLRYKDIPFTEKAIDYHTFMVKAKKNTGAAVMPVIVTPDGEWLGDTSEIIDRLEREFPKAPVVPSTPVQKIASLLIEMWGDEWWLPVAMYTRWCHPENYPLFEHDAGTGLMPWLPWFIQKRFGAKAANQMRGHLPSLGIVPEQTPLMDRWTRHALDQLEAHFAQQPFLFGSRPSIGDFGMIGPLYAHLGRDPWSKRELIDPRKHLAGWIGRMQHPQPLAGAFLPNDQIPATLEPIFLSIFSEFLPLLKGIIGEVEAAIQHRAPGKPLPRGLGVVEFPMLDGHYKRAAIPYILWMAQRILDAHAGMDAQAKLKVREWLRGLGGEEFLDLKFPRLRRLGLRVAPESPETAAAA